MTFEGFLPVLGGNEGTLRTELGLRVLGGADEGGNRTATPEVVRFHMEFNGVRMPLDLEIAQDFFPKAKVVFEPAGRVIRNEAPDRGLPIRVPGLDPQRLPEATWMPVVFPEQGIGAGSEWTYQSRLGETDVTHRCRVVSLEGANLVVAVESTQKYEVYENSALEVVRDRRDAVARATTEWTAKGRLEFDIERSQLRKWTLESNAVTNSTDLVSGVTTTRRLKGNTEVMRSGQGLVTRSTSRPPVEQARRPDESTVAGWVSSLVHQGRQAGQLAWSWAMAAAMYLPGDWRLWLRDRLDRAGLGAHYRVLTTWQR